jgi:NAD(P)-dependent dehydrogenase (short-subunit alcohol dehydrogenase family)
MNLSDEKRVCIVTGSSSGIGAATALWFAQRRHNVVINYARNAEAAQAVAGQCRAAGAEALVVRADVADDADCQALAREAAQRWGGVDTLVNNAGVSPKFVSPRDLDALSAEDFLDTYRVNVVGAFQMCRAVAPLMAGRANPSIVNISSMAGLMGTGSSMAYAASKGALNTLTLALARSLGPAIRVNAILPGMVNGEWLRKGLGAEKFEAARKRYESRALLNTVIEGDDAASTAYWLALHATKLTGQLIQLDAGFRLG